MGDIGDWAKAIRDVGDRAGPPTPRPEMQADYVTRVASAAADRFERVEARLNEVGGAVQLVRDDMQKQIYGIETVVGRWTDRVVKFAGHLDTLQQRVVGLQDEDGPDGVDALEAVVLDFSRELVGVRERMDKLEQAIADRQAPERSFREEAKENSAGLDEVKRLVDALSVQVDRVEQSVQQARNREWDREELVRRLELLGESIDGTDAVVARLVARLDAEVNSRADQGQVFGRELEGLKARVAEQEEWMKGWFVPHPSAIAGRGSVTAGNPFLVPPADGQVFGRVGPGVVQQAEVVDLLRKACGVDTSPFPPRPAEPEHIGIEPAFPSTFPPGFVAPAHSVVIGPDLLREIRTGLDNAAAGRVRDLRTFVEELKRDFDEIERGQPATRANGPDVPASPAPVFEPHAAAVLDQITEVWVRRTGLGLVDHASFGREVIQILSAMGVKR
jgi:hypothetical protein